MDDTYAFPDESRTSTPSSFGSPLGGLELSLPGSTRPHLQLSRPPSLSEDSSLYQWSVPQSQHMQSDSYPGSPLAHSGSPALPYERFRSVSSLSHRSNDRQMEELQARCEQLTNQNALLETEVQSIKYAYETLINRVPALLSSDVGINKTVPSPALNEADFPDVSFWTRDKWMAHEKAGNTLSNGQKSGVQGGSQMSKGINISMRFVEDKHGVVIDGFHVKAILGGAHQMFFQLRDVKKHPKTWGAAGTDILRAYCQEMELQYPELALCADSWKAKYIAMLNYSSWYNTHGKTVIKVEDSDDSDDMDVRQPTKKRRPSHEVSKSSKKTKSDPSIKQDQQPHTPSPVSVVVIVPIPPASPVGSRPSPVLIVNPLFASKESSTVAQAVSSVPTATTTHATAEPVVTPERPSSPESLKASSLSIPLFVPPPSRLEPAETSIAAATSTPTMPLVPDSPKPAGLPKLSAAITVVTAAPLPANCAHDEPILPNIILSDKAPLKNTKYVPSKTSTTPRNLCGQDWCIANPGSTMSQFSEYWQSIKDTAEEKKYTMLSNSAKDAMSTAAARA